LVAAGQEICVVFLFGASLGEKPPLRHNFGFYFPKILSSLNNRTYPARVTNQLLNDVNRDDANIEISDVERWRDRVLAAIDQGYVEDVS